MKCKLSIVIVVLLGLSNIATLSSEAAKNKKTKKESTAKVRKYDSVTKTETKSQVAETEEELISVRVSNEFDKEIRVMIGKGRTVTVPPNEVAIIGNRKPGKYTFTIYNDDGDIVDTVTKNIKQNKFGNDKFAFRVNADTISNESKIEGLSTGKKVAIGAGAVGAVALLGKALSMGDAPAVPQVAEPTFVDTIANSIPQAAVPAATSNAFNPTGRAFKFLNAKYDEVTLIVEGTDGLPIGSNWTITKAGGFQQAQPLLFSGQKVTLGDKQKVTLRLRDGLEVSRYAFELDVDPVDGSFVWVVK